MLLEKSKVVIHVMMVAAVMVMMMMMKILMMLMIVSKGLKVMKHLTKLETLMMSQVKLEFLEDDSVCNDACGWDCSSNESSTSDLDDDDKADEDESWLDSVCFVFEYWLWFSTFAALDFDAVFITDLFVLVFDFAGFFLLVSTAVFLLFGSRVCTLFVWLCYTWFPLCFHTFLWWFWCGFFCCPFSRQGFLLGSFTILCLCCSSLLFRRCWFLWFYCTCLFSLLRSDAFWVNCCSRYLLFQCTF